MTTITDTLVDLGRSAFAQGNLPEAEVLFRRAYAAGRGDAEVLYFLGFIARDKGDLADAGNFYAAALARNPADAQLHNNLAEVRRAQKRDAEAIALYRRAATLAPDKAEIHGNLGALLMALRRPEEALPHLLRALELKPDLLPVRNEASIALSSLGRYEEAQQHYRAAIHQQPANADARYLEALAFLAVGDFERGWRRHESRWYAELGRVKRRLFNQPYWLGEDNLNGRAILLHAEQGFGDTLQFVRYAPMVAALGGKVVLEVQPPLKTLLLATPQTGGVFARDEALPQFDTHCSMMSLPRAFRTALGAIPAEVPYLRVPSERLHKWREPLRPSSRGGLARRRIAIAWSGSFGGPWNRDIELAMLLPLLLREDCEFHVAQVEIKDDDRQLLAETPQVVDHSAELTDFADTAALVSQMDLVISVDTALAHLAGALALPVWTLLPLGADYRWMMHRTDSPWYPTMRLFRQSRLKDWSAVVQAVGDALDAHET